MLRALFAEFASARCRCCCRRHVFAADDAMFCQPAPPAVAARRYSAMPLMAPPARRGRRAMMAAVSASELPRCASAAGTLSAALRGRSDKICQACYVLRVMRSRCCQRAAPVPPLLMPPAGFQASRLSIRCCCHIFAIDISPHYISPAAAS